MPLTPFHGPPAQPPVVPGFVARTLLGLGAHGEVWAAREQITGDEVALKIGRRLGGDDGESASREAGLLARLDHPHLIRLRRVVPMPDGGAAMVLDLAAGGSLAALLAARGPLDPGEAVTMLVPLATVLAELHGQSVVHGDLAPGNVLFAADGRPLLGDLGVSSILGSRRSRAWSTPGFADPALAGGGDPRAGDIWALGAVACFALTGRPPLDDVAALPPELGPLIRSCLAASPAERPSLEEIAERAWAAVPARPIRLTVRQPEGGPGVPPMRTGIVPGPGPEPELSWVTMTSTPRPAEDLRVLPDPRMARPGRRQVAAAVIGCLLTVAAVVAWQGTSPAGSPGSPGPVPAQVRSARAGADPGSRAGPGSGQQEAAITAALQQIAAARARAFKQASTKPLAAADEPGSPAERMDAALVDRLAGAGVRLDGVSYRIGQVQLVASTPGLVDVRAVVTTSGHRQVSLTGHSSQPIDEVGPERVGLRLVRVDEPSSRWLVRSVRAVSG